MKLTKAQQRVISLMEPGIWYLQTELKTSRQVMNGLRDLKLIKRRLRPENSNPLLSHQFCLK